MKTFSNTSCRIFRAWNNSRAKAPRLPRGRLDVLPLAVFVAVPRDVGRVSRALAGRWRPAVKAPATAENLRSRLSHVIPLLVAICLFAAPDVPLPPLNARFVPLALWPPALGAALTFVGLAFSVWARFTLADNWSSDVQVKRGHELIVEGPYRWCPPSDLYRAHSARSWEPRSRWANGAPCLASRSPPLPSGASSSIEESGDARRVRRGLRPLRRARAGAHSVRCLKASALTARACLRPRQ